jgi:hypothetical protein
MRLQHGDVLDALVESRIAKHVDECCLRLDGFRRGDIHRTA